MIRHRHDKTFECREAFGICIRKLQWGLIRLIFRGVYRPIMAVGPGDKTNLFFQSLLMNIRPIKYLISLVSKFKRFKIICVHKFKELFFSQCIGVISTRSPPR